jgi:hypothetical protein
MKQTHSLGMLESDLLCLRAGDSYGAGQRERSQMTVLRSNQQSLERQQIPRTSGILVS